MRLKEIKPGMVIHCKTEEEANALMVELDRLGYRWINARCIGDNRYNFYRGETCYCISNCRTITYSGLDYYKENKREITEFSDLIISELSANEVLETMKEICRNVKGCVNCPLDGECTPATYLFDAEKMVDACTKWREEHPKEEKKELETEWVYVVRIIKVHDNGKKECVHEVDASVTSKDSYLPFSENEAAAERELKDYCNNHEGNFFATIEHICRIKE